MRGVKSHRFPKMRNRLNRPVLFKKGDPEIVVRIRIVWCSLERLGKKFD